jgi:hypothetical protein
MSLKEKYFKNNRKAVDDSKSSGLEEKLKLEDYVSRLNNYMNINRESMFTNLETSTMVNNESSPAASDLKPD